MWKINQTGAEDNYGYDALSRLTSVTSPTLGNQSFAFDANGNRTSHTWGGATDTYSATSPGNRLPSITGSRAKTFTYDAQLGNLTAQSGYGGSYSYGYDSFNRLSTVPGLDPLQGLPGARDCGRSRPALVCGPSAAQ